MHKKCLNPNASLYKFGLFYPFLFILLLILLLGILLWMEWRCSKRLLYAHIIKREKDALHVENEDQKTRMIQGQKMNGGSEI